LTAAPIEEVGYAALNAFTVSDSLFLSRGLFEQGKRKEKDEE
jgi:hypothetical protein